MTQDQVRRDFCAYYADLRAAQLLDRAPVPRKRDEWEGFVARMIDDGTLTVEALQWPCPRN
jgi:hypothetical protein